MNLSSHWLTARSGLTLRQAAGAWKIEGLRSQLILENPADQDKAVLLQLFSEGGGEKELTEGATGREGSLRSLHPLLDRLEAHGMICRSITNRNGRLATLVPIGSRYRYLPAVGDAEVRYGLSRFAYCRQGREGLVMESPLSQAMLELHQPCILSLVHELARRPHTVLELSQKVSEAGGATALAFLELATSGGFVTQQNEGQAAAEPGDGLRTWEFHDLLFHSRSRLGRHGEPYGATYRFEGQMAAPPTLKPPMSQTAIALDVPDLEAITRQDRRLTSVLETRRSIRRFGAVPITKSQLSEFLFRIFRLKRLVPGARGELAERPYPSGGSLYELEVYPVVDRCDGLDPGLYHYRCGDHALSRLAAPEGAVCALLDQAWWTMNREGRPQVLFVVTARFARLAWKYQSVAYSLVLKHVGVVYQTMYLVATAMGLAPCALGGGDSELFATASGLDYATESSVGEFALGTCPE